MSRLIDLTGWKFGRLTVLERGPDHVTAGGNSFTQWKCKCDCGNTCFVSGAKLRKGHTKSCGCYKAEFMESAWHELNRKSNRYEDHGDYMIGYTTKGEPYIIDAEDFDKVKDICWYKRPDGYVVGESGGKRFRLHRLVVDAADGEVVDHMNHKPEDNRKANLRVVSQNENMRNMGLRKNNTSGVIGVGWDKARQKWCAFITVNGKTIGLGRFNDIELAIEARRIAEEKYFGRYSYASSIEQAMDIGSIRVDHLGLEVAV